MKKSEIKVHEERLTNSLSRTRRLFFDYAMCNRFSVFCTLTFSKEKAERYDFTEISKKLRKFFNNYRNRYCPEFRYLLIPELHEDGAIHFHGFITKPHDLECPAFIPKKIDGEVKDVPNTKGYLSWNSFSVRFGYFSGSYILDYEKAVSYCTSYITKAFSDIKFKNKQLLFKSQGLNLPEKVYVTYDRVNIMPDYENEFCAVAWKSEYDTLPLYRHWDYIEGLDIPVDEYMGLPLYEQMKIENLKGKGVVSWIQSLSAPSRP